MGWSSTVLQPDYGRCLVGFDVRELRKEAVPASLSAAVWQQAKAAGEVEAADFANGFNLFIVIDPLLGLSGEHQVVAFDLPTSLVGVIAATFGLRPLPLPSVDAWSFLGFDVVDPRTQSSAIYDLPSAKPNAVLLNASGLIDDEFSAIQTALAADARVPEHAPFCPCGVWLRAKGHAKGQV